MPTSIDEKTKESKDYLDAWRGFKDENPGLYTAAAILPGTGQVAAVADYADAMDRRDTKDGVLAAASLIPGFKLAKTVSKLAPAAIRLKSQMSATEKAIAPVVKKAPQIGQAAAAEQVGSYILGDDKPKDDPSAEYLEAWGREDRRDGPPSSR